MTKICISTELNEFLNKLSTVNKIGFFFGAGTSMALGMPGINQLTLKILSQINTDGILENILNQLKLEKESKSNITIEDILNKIRMIRELTNDREEYNYLDLTGKAAKKLDIDICNNIYQILLKKENIILSDEEKFNIPKKFFVWLNNLNKDEIIEVFTTNYDLIFERALETLEIPFFDGFIGAYKPFFCQESVENITKLSTMPFEWIRLWKLHGSLGWFWEEVENRYKVIRLGSNSKELNNNELVIYPSKDKYQSSRKQPFISYFDRLKSHLSYNEGMFIISGYSFGDEHINDIFFDALRKNQRLHIIVLLFKDDELKKIKDKAILYPNMTLLSPTKGVVGGKYGSLAFDKPKLEQNGFEEYTSDNRLQIADFSIFIDFLIVNSGKKYEILEEIGGNNE